MSLHHFDHEPTCSGRDDDVGAERENLRAAESDVKELVSGDHLSARERDDSIILVACVRGPFTPTCFERVKRSDEQILENFEPRLVSRL